MKKYILLCLLLISSIAYSAEIMPLSRFYGFGGLNTRDKNTAIADNEASDIQNINLSDEVGSIKKRNGYDAIADTPTISGYMVQDGFDYKRYNGDQYTIVCSSYTIKKLNSGGTDWDTLCSTTTVVANTDFTDFVVYSDTNSTLLITNGKDIIKKYTGGSATEDLGTGTDPDDWRPATAKYIELFKGRIFVANLVEANGGVTDITAPFRVRWASDVGSRNIEGADAWPANSYYDIDNTEIRGMAVLGVSLVVFGEHCIEMISGDMTDGGSFYRNKMVDGIGCASNRTIKNVPGLGLVFLATDGHIYSFTGGNFVTKLSDKITGTINDLNKARLGQACAEYYPKYSQYRISLANTTNTTNNIELVLDTRTGSWMKNIGINASAMWIKNNSGVLQLLTGDTSSTGLVYLQDTGSTDNGSAISAYYQTKSFGLDLNEYSKIFDAIYVQYNQSGAYAVDLQASIDFDRAVSNHQLNLTPNGAVWGSIVWGNFTWTGNTIVLQEYPIEQEGSFIRFKFSNSNASQPFTIYGFTLRYQPIPLR